MLKNGAVQVIINLVTMKCQNIVKKASDVAIMLCGVEVTGSKPGIIPSPRKIISFQRFDLNRSCNNV